MFAGIWQQYINMLKLRNRIEQLFPYKPYPSQIDLCEKIYESLLEGKKMSIFESPTGTGKSVCSIIGALLWLIDSYEGTLEKNEKQKTEGLPDWFNDVETEQVPITMAPQKLDGQRKHPEQSNKMNQNKGVKKSDEDDEYYFDVESDDENEYKASINYLKAHHSSNKPLKIIYASRTHSQIKQWVNEINKIEFIKSKIKLVSLGSRQQLCVNSQIIRQANSNIGLLNQLCKSKQKSSAKAAKENQDKCPYYTRYLTWKNEQGSQFRDNSLLDIEDLKQEGVKCNTCPYYASKELEGECEVICLPYQLLLDRIDDFRDQVILIDEAHNLSSAIQSNSSVTLSQIQVITVHEGLQIYKNKYSRKIKPKTLYLLNIAIDISNKLNSIVQANQIEDIRKFCILQFMMDLNLINLDLSKLLMFLNNKDLIVRLNAFIDNQGNKKAFQCWETFIKFTTKLILSNQSDFLLYKEKDQNSQYKLKITCLKNDSAMMDLVYKCKSVILIGGTMKPLNELEIYQEKIEQGKFQLMSFPHIIPENNCRLFIVPGLNKPLSLNFKNKQDRMSEILSQIHQILILLIQSIPKGLVVFFTSYQMLENVKQYLNEKKFRKKLFWDSPKSQDLLTNYQKEIKNDEGAVLFSVIGGILSEGINFSDDLCRGIVVFGVPYPNLQSIEVQEQMKIQKDSSAYLDNLAMKAVNQSVGRAIRHNKDYALMFLVDYAYKENRLRGKLSDWLQNRVTILETANKIETQTQEFFQKFTK